MDRLPRDGKCARCRCVIPPGHGFCSSCAWREDGYRCGAEYCDDFDGVSESDAIAFYEETKDGAFDQHATEAEWIDITPDAAREQFYMGMLAGLKNAARANDEKQSETDDAERAFGPNQAQNYRGRNGY